MKGTLEDFLAHWSYSGVALVLLLAGFGLPIPEDIPLVIAGYLCGDGKASLSLMVPLCIVAVFGGDSILYALGRRYGHHVPRLPFLKHYLTPERLERAGKRFHDHGGKTLFAARFMPAVRAALFFTAGTFKIPYSKMLIFDGGAALFSVPAWILLGWYFHDHIDWLLHGIEEGKAAATWILLGIIVLIVLIVILKRRRRKTD